MNKAAMPFFLAAFWAALVFGQDGSTNRTVAAMQIADLKSGALIVRLKTHENSLDAYRRAGRPDIAERIMKEREAQNRKIANAFSEHFDFCKVHFILAKNSKQMLEGNRNVFLNKYLEPDSSVSFNVSRFFFAEYGSITSNLRTDEYHYSSVNKTEPSTSTASSSVIFISDTSSTQLREPFPFYQPVYLDNYAKAVEKLNRALYKSYYTLVEAPKLKK